MCFWCARLYTHFAVIGCHNGETKYLVKFRSLKCVNAEPSLRYKNAFTLYFIITLNICVSNEEKLFARHCFKSGAVFTVNGPENSCRVHLYSKSYRNFSLSIYQKNPVKRTILKM